MTPIHTPVALTEAQTRTQQKLVAAAMRLAESGALPTLTEVAASAGFSRATAYRYFPTQSALVAAMVEESLRPIIEWHPQHPHASERISELLRFAYPRMLEHEGVLRAALQLSLQQWSEKRRDPHAQETLVRGNRKKILKRVVEPLEGRLSPQAIQRTMHAFSLIYGSEVFMVMKDIWQVGDGDIQDLTQWMAKAILRQAEEDARLGSEQD
ncbi:AcrR family transcriptional regulator [Ewingella americana]|uniref:TetR family transcriptional regulator n=2 Tax=Ewingella americana TaxID=41202 RepID=A0A085G146_EWIA3|nr:TetR/AcrR family transcriptional regulator [Ewingella americana]KFC77441.1 TetR family transcriptional regulator [Ewingella americana ATCC 33852]STS10393.1 Bacterial regulatory proteins, tetR family [Ewingella americana]